METVTWIVLAHSEAFKSGERAGRVSAILMLLVGVAKCVEVARRPAANGKSLIGLGLVLTGWAMFAGLGLAKPGPEITVAWGFGAMGLAVAGITLGLVGLVEWFRHPGRYAQGLRQSVAALLVGAAIVGSVSIGFYKGAQKGRPPVLASGASLPGQRLLYPERNFSFRPPPAPWVRLDIQKLNPAATLGFLRRDPEVNFMLIAEVLGPGVETVALVEMAKGNLKAKAASLHLVEEGPHEINGLDGYRVVIDAQMMGKPLRYVFWVLNRNGVTYQLIAGGPAESGDVYQHARSLFEGFDLIDRNRVLFPAGEASPEDHASAGYGFSIRLKGSAWKRTEELARQNQFVEFGAQHRLHDAWLAVIPVCLMGLEPDRRELALALLARMDVTEQGLLPRAPGPRGSPADGAVQEWEYNRTVQGTPFVYRFRVVARGGFAWLLAAWLPKAGEGLKHLLEDILGRVTLTPPDRPPAPGSLPAAARLRHALVLNHIGLARYNARAFQDAARYFTAAFGHVPDDAALLANLADAWKEAGEYRRAGEVLDQHAQRFPGNERIAALQAAVREKRGSGLPAKLNGSGK